MNKPLGTYSMSTLDSNLVPSQMCRPLVTLFAHTHTHTHTHTIIYVLLYITTSNTPASFFLIMAMYYFMVDV